MNNLASQPRIILIGGTSHMGKSTLGKTIARELKGQYVATDNLARHPGRPWSIEENKTIKPYVVEHYQSLSAPKLLSDVLIHYKQNVLPQVIKLIQTHNSHEYLVIEGSALYPRLVANIVSSNNVRGIWLAGSYSLLKNRIFINSNFYRARKEQRYLIYKFLERTWLYNQAMMNDLKELEFKWIGVNFETGTDELRNRCYQELAIIC